MKPIFKTEHGAVLSGYTEGRKDVIIPAAMDYIATEGEIFDYLVSKLKFNEFLEELRSRTYQGADHSYPKRLAQLKEDLEDGRVEIKIALEYIKPC